METSSGERDDADIAFTERSILIVKAEPSMPVRNIADTGNDSILYKSLLNHFEQKEMTYEFLYVTNRSVTPPLFQWRHSCRRVVSESLPEHVEC